MADYPLTGTVVVDCTEGVAGGYGSWLLAALGARVLKVEPPGGDRLRRLGPFADDLPEPERGGLHLALNAGKESVVLDVHSSAGRGELKRLLATADILLETAGPGVMDSLGLGYGELASEFPALVYASHSPFGSDGPYAGRLSSEIVDYAMGGWMYFCGEPGKPPLMVPGYQAELHAGMQLAAGALAALWEARRSGVGQHVDVSTFESMVSAHVFLLSNWMQEGKVDKRRGTTLVACADGLLLVAYPRPQLYTLIGDSERADDPRWEDPARRPEARAELLADLAGWVAGRTKAEVHERAQELRINAVTPVDSIAELAASSQLAARQWWKTVDHPVAEALELPGPPWAMSRSQTGTDAAAPLLGVHRPLGETTERPATRSDDGLPFNGLRVVEVTNSWAGPLCGMHFADLGADVIVVDAPIAQATRSWHYPAGQSWPYALNRGHGFHQFNRNKRSVCFDLQTEGGKELFLRLIETADVLIENNSPGVFPRLGLPFEALEKRNPRLISCSIPAFGSEGPLASYRAAGSNMEATTAVVSRTGYGPGDLHATGSFHTDPIGGTHATIGIIAALMERERSGRGQHIEVPLLDSGAIFAVESLMDYRLNGRVAGPLANRSPSIAPQGAYRAAGDDCWLALAVESDEQWQRLCATLERPELAERFPTAEARLAAHDEIDRAIEAWSADLDHNEATRRLQAAGVPAGPVLANWELVSDPHLSQRGYWIETVHPEVGFQRYEGLPWKLSRTPPPTQARPAPLFGEHNDEVVQGDLGLNASQITSLRASGAVLDQPRALRAMPLRDD